MNKLLLLLIVSVFAMTPTQAQNNQTDFVEAIKKKNLLTDKGIEELRKELKLHKNKPYKLTILNFLATSFAKEFFYRIFINREIERKIVSEDEPLEFSYVLYPFAPGASGTHNDYKSLIHPTRSVKGGTRTRTLEDFKELKLIRDVVYQNCSKKLKDTTIKHEKDLVNYIAEKEGFYITYPEQKKQELTFAKKLIGLKILSSDDFSRLAKSYQDWELKKKHGVLAFSSSCKVIDLTAFEPNPEKIYSHIFKELQALIPNFNYTNLKFELIEEKPRRQGLNRVDLKISFDINQYTYAHLFFYDYKWFDDRKQQVKKSAPSKINTKFHKGINKYLIDIGSKYLLHTIDIEDNNSVYGRRKIGLIVLNKEQASFFSKNMSLLSRESFSNRFSTKKIKAMIDDFEKIGLFSHLSQVQKSKAKAAIAHKEVKNFQDILSEFDNAEVTFDWEMNNLENPYQAITERLSKASRGLFTPTRIIDGFREAIDKRASVVAYGFTFKNKQYKADLRLRNDWFDPAFFYLIKRALRENKVKGKFYDHYEDAQVGGYIFLTPQQLEFIKKKYPMLLTTKE